MTEQPMPAFVDDADAPDTSTVALLFDIFGDVLIPLEDVRKRYYRNLNTTTLRRAISDWRIPLPIVTVDASAKAQPYVCIYHLAALIEARAIEAAKGREVMITTSDADRRLRQRQIDAVPLTEFQDVALATPGQ